MQYERRQVRQYRRRSASVECTKTNPIGPCATGRPWLGDSCCDWASGCGAACCAVGQTCAGAACRLAEESSQTYFKGPATASSTCGLSCTATLQCPTAAPCSRFAGRGGGCVCAPANGASGCLCAADGADSSNIPGNGACVPDGGDGLVTEKAWVCRPTTMARQRRLQRRVWQPRQ
jgi:hypothetical protein